MINKYKNEEFYNIIKPVLNIAEFHELKDISHHGISRFEHSMRVAFYSYKVSKFLRLKYKEITVAALLHDFFHDEVKEENGYQRLIKHPEYAVINAKKHIKLSSMQEDIIKNHMFPVTISLPKHKESYMVSFVDNVAAVYEKSMTTKQEIATASTFLFLLMINIFSF